MKSDNRRREIKDSPKSRQVGTSFIRKTLYAIGRWEKEVIKMFKVYPSEDAISDDTFMAQAIKED